MADGAVIAHNGPLEDGRPILQTDVVAKDGAPHFHPRAQVRMVPEDGALDAAHRHQDTVGPQDGTLKIDSRTHPAVWPKKQRSLQLGFRVEPSPFLHPDPRGDFLPRKGEVDSPREEIVMGLAVLLQVADVGPIPWRHIPIQGSSLGQQQGKEILAEVEFFPRRDVVKDLRFQNVDPGVYRIAKNLAPTRFFQELLNATLAVGDDYPILERSLHFGQDQGG